MKKFIFLLFAFFSLSTFTACSFAHVLTGNFFIINSEGDGQHQQHRWFKICLLENEKVNCDDFVTIGNYVYIKTLKPVSSTVQFNAGIKDMRKFDNSLPQGCQMMNNEYCAFKVNNNQWTLIII